MIEALTPPLLMVSLLLVIAISSTLSLLIAVLLLTAYRHSVLRTMAAPAGRGARPAVTCDATPNFRAVAQARRTGSRDSAEAYYRRALQAARVAAWRTVAAGLAFALVTACAASLAFAPLQSLRGLALSLWIGVWPILVALMLTEWSGRTPRLMGVAGYFALFLAVIALSAAMTEISALGLGTGSPDYLNTITPPQMLAGWLLANGPPTALLLLFVNRRLRAVGPLVLGFATALTSGLMAALLSMMTPGAAGAVANIARTTGLPVFTVQSSLVIAALAASAGAGWALLRWIKHAYLAKQANDRSLTLDALWLLFAAWYSMVLALAGLAWVFTGLLGFVAYKAAAAWMRRKFVRHSLTVEPRALVFLRVFALGPRSEQLLDKLARYWRYIGSVDLITGPDVAHSTVQPHQLLDFLAGRLTSHFIADANALDTQMRQQRDLAADHDGWFRVNNFFCYADTWEHVLPRLVQGGDVVLMDLRSFSQHNAGCIHELRHLVHFVPLQRCVLVVDGTTDMAFMRQTVAQAWASLPAKSPNRPGNSASLPIHHLGRGTPAIRGLLRHLCSAE